MDQVEADTESNMRTLLMAIFKTDIMSEEVRRRIDDLRDDRPFKIAQQF